MKKIIYTTEITSEDLNAAKESLVENGLEVNEQTIYQELCEQKDQWLNDESMNLSHPLDERIILIADIGRWNGRKSGYKIIGNNIKEIFSSMSEGEVEFFGDTKDRQIKAIQRHHDGTNYIMFREIKPNVNIDNLTNKIYNGIATPKDISRYTRSLYPHVASAYGW